MKNLKFFSAFLLIIISAFFVSSSMYYSPGSPGGYTGSPIDAKNCTLCHGGSATSADNYITTDIPAEGYTPGQTYSITVSYTGTGDKGFELTSETDASKIGQFIAGTGTKLVNSNNAITQTSVVETTQADWNFTWTAPEQGTGDLTFYSALTVNMGSTKLCSISVSENPVSEITVSENVFRIYPNPAQNIISVVTSTYERKTIKIFDEAGKLCLSKNIYKKAEIDITNLSCGIYTVIVSNKNEIKTKKFIKK